MQSTYIWFALDFQQEWWINFRIIAFGLHDND